MAELHVMTLHWWPYFAQVDTIKHYRVKYMTEIVLDNRKQPHKHHFIAVSKIWICQQTYANTLPFLPSASKYFPPLFVPFFQAQECHTSFFTGIIETHKRLKK